VLLFALSVGFEDSLVEEEIEDDEEEEEEEDEADEGSSRG
jgi:hypothetical protein